MTNDESININDTQEENRAPSRPVIITTFEGEVAIGKPRQGTFRDFFTAWQSRPVVPAETPKAGWTMLAPALFAGHRRSNANVQRVYLQVVEFDNTEKQLDENGKPRSVALAVDRRCTVAQAISFVRERGWESIVVTSYSHTPEHPKFRIYMTTTRPVLPDEHRRVQRHLHREFADAGCSPDPATMDPARPWYTPIRREGHEYIVQFVEGSPINVDTVLASVGAEIDTRQTGEADTRLRQWLTNSLKPAIDFTALLEAEGERLTREGHYAKLWSPFRDDGNKPGCVVYDDHYFDFGTLETIDAIGYMTRKREIDFWSACDVLADQYGVPRFERSKARLPAVIDPKELFDTLPNALPDTGREDLLRPVCKAIATLDEADRDVWITRVVERFGKCGRKQNLDRKVVEKLVRDSHKQVASRVTEDTTPIDTRYEIANGCLSLVEVREEGTRTRPLLNGTLRIESAITHDDGAEQRKFFRIAGAMANGNPVAPFEVEQSKYDSLEWLTDKTNGRLRVEPGKALKDYLRHAVLTTSTYTDSTIYAHTGWREIDGRQVFFHAGGAIGGGIEVKLPDRLQKYTLAEAPAAFAGKREDEATAVRREAVRTAIRIPTQFLSVAGHRITVPLFTSMVTAPIRTALAGGQAAITIIGKTGNRKTALAVQATRFYAASVKSDGDLPLNADSTATAIELLLHAAKDLPVVIDDAFPRGRRQDAERQIGLLRNVVHNYANGQVRLRASADVQLRVARAPRCGALWLTMEEDLISPTTGESTSNRSLKVDIGPGDVKLDKLSELQATDIGQGGRLYLEWLVANPTWRESAPRRYMEIVADLRKVEGLQARQPEVIAALVVGAEVYGDHIVSLAREFPQFALLDTWKDTFTSAIRSALIALVKAQTEIAKSQSPTAHYLDNIRTLIRTGRGEVLASNQPLSGHERAVGWYDDDTLAFECTALHAAVARLRDDNGEPPPPAWRTIYRDLVSEGLAEKPTDDRHAGTRCSRGGGRGYFLVVTRKAFEDVPIGVGANNGLDPRFTGIDIEDMTSPSWKPTKGDA